MDKVTQHNAANAEESESASEELSAQAEQMNQIVGELTTLVSGTSEGHATQTTSPSRGAGNLGVSDNTFHQIAAKVDTLPQKANAKVSPEAAIPLAEGDDFTDFNS